MSDIPRGDAAFDTWQSQTVTYLNANLAALGLVPIDPQVVAVNDAQADWEITYPAHLAAQAAAQAATQTKDASRAAYEAALRALIQRLQASPDVDDAERAALGITVPDRVRTPVTAPTVAPVLTADTSRRLRVTVSFGTPTDDGGEVSRAKPPGVTGCEIWMKVGGPPPADLSECQFLALDTRTPYTAEFDGADAGQTAHFIGRWVSTRGEPGPLSETLSATIPG